MVEDRQGEQPGSRPRRSSWPDYSGPAFTPREDRERAVDALPYSPRQRRAVWWQIVVMALVADAATVWLIVRAVLDGESAPFGVAILTAVMAIPLTWAAWRLRRLRRAPDPGTGSPAGGS